MTTCAHMQLPASHLSLQCRIFYSQKRRSFQSCVPEQKNCCTDGRISSCTENEFPYKEKVSISNTDMLASLRTFSSVRCGKYFPRLQKHLHPGIKFPINRLNGNFTRYEMRKWFIALIISAVSAITLPAQTI